jgi:S1-C subfamily serine protease
MSILRHRSIPLWIALVLAILGLALSGEIAFIGIPWWAGLVGLWRARRRLPRLSAGQITLLWMLATAVLLAGFAIYTAFLREATRDLDVYQILYAHQVRLVITALLTLFLVLMILLVRACWSVLAAQGAGSVLAGSLVAVLVCVWASSLLLAGSVAVFGLDLSSEDEVESYYDPGPARIAWRRPAPEPWDLVVLAPGDVNPRREGSLYERLAGAVVSISNGEDLGTAFLISRDGLALTNHHVIDVLPPLWAGFGGDAQRRLRVLRWDEETDVALVQIDCPEECATVELGAGDGTVIGSDVMVVGTPNGLAGTLTRGVLSSRRFADGATLLQFDAPVSPGSSGSPLVDAEAGRVIGIVTSKVMDEGHEGLGFGVEIEDALRVLGVRRQGG